RKIGRAEADDLVACEVAPTVRFGIGRAVEFPAVCEDRRELVELGGPLRGRPIAAVEMAAAMACGLMAFRPRLPDLPEALHDIAARFGKADIRASGTGVRRLVDGAILARDEIDAGQEIGEARPGFLRERAAAVPLFKWSCAVE